MNPVNVSFSAFEKGLESVAAMVNGAAGSLFLLYQMLNESKKKSGCPKEQLVRLRF